MEHWYFKPVDNFQGRSQQGVMSRLRGPLATVARWIALIGMGICEAIRTGDLSQVQLHNLWIEYIEGGLRRELTYDTSSGRTQERRSDWVHVSWCVFTRVKLPYLSPRTRFRF